jgi:AmmeMemoRadiSam system protein B/AmmeMemoRadiSam system protein A
MRAVAWSCGLCVVMLLFPCRHAGPMGNGILPAAFAQPEAYQERTESSRVFASPLAGTWYDADRQTLADEIDGILSKATGEKLDNVCALILPHAGYRYSGPTAAHAIRQVQGRAFKRVIVIGPSHRTRMENVASVPDFTHYATPLGRVPLDRQFIAELRKHRSFQNIPHAHVGEHSVQIELPLLQRALGDFQFVPIVVGELDRPTMLRMAAIIRGLIDPQTLVVASSDFTHYGRNYGYVPFTDDVPDKLKKLDTGAFDLIAKKDVDGLLNYIDKTGTTICGRHPIGVLLSMLPADAQVHRLHYDTSGRMLGDYSNSVSYCAIAVTGKWPVTQRVAPAPEASDLSAAEKARLLKLARGTLTYVLENWRIPTPEQLDVPITPAMKQVSGVFVTLRKDGELRGCIGEIFPVRPLYKGVILQAIGAGLNDKRFPRVKSSELNEIDFEISVLTAPCPVASAGDIVVGKHGVVLKKAGRTAVFLPQVAVEEDWDRESMLTHLAQKAGLPGDGWREGASFDVFEAIVFGEKKETEE